MELENHIENKFLLLSNMVFFILSIEFFYFLVRPQKVNPMRNRIAQKIFMLSLLVSTSSHAQNHDLASLSWLAGCWASETAEAGSGEQWMPLAGGTMLGVGRTVKNGRTAEYEFLQIRHNAEGKLVYIAKPSGQTEATFTAIQLSDNAVTFENLQHDFPQRIIYRRLADGKLAARIEGLRGGSVRGIDFPMISVSCSALVGKAAAK
jgi:hypothetical protein